MNRSFSIEEVINQVGLEESAMPQSPEALGYFSLAAAIGFADGDLGGRHRRHSGYKAELYGVTDFAEGRIAKIMGEAARENGNEPGPLYDFQVWAASRLADPSDRRFPQFVPTSVVRVSPDAIFIDNNPVRLRQLPRVIIDYGTCLNSLSYLDDQAAFEREGHRPFTLMGIAGSVFMNYAMMFHYKNKLGEDTTHEALYAQYGGRQDGVAASVDAIRSIHGAEGKTTEMADVIVLKGTQHMDVKNIRAGAKGAYGLLREGGVFIVRAACKAALPGAQVEHQQIIDWALGSGFEEKNVTALHRRHGVVETQHGPTELDVQTTVLTK